MCSPYLILKSCLILGIILGSNLVIFAYLEETRRKRSNLRARSTTTYNINKEYGLGTYDAQIGKKTIDKFKKSNRGIFTEILRNAKNGG